MASAKPNPKGDAVAARQSTKISASKILLLASASFAALSGLCPAQAVLPTDFLDFATTGSLSAWTTYSTVTTTNSTDNLTLLNPNTGVHTPFQLTPAANEYMAKIYPVTSTSPSCATPTNCSAIDTLMGLNSGTLSNIFNPLPVDHTNSKRATNFAIMTETVSLTAGTYTFYWSFASGDYPDYNDGVLFAIKGNDAQTASVETVSVLASTGTTTNKTGGAQADTVVVGDNGTTQWTAHTFSLDTAGTYQVSFAAYNWGDTYDLNVPTFYIGAHAGTVVNLSSASPIDTNAAYYSTAGLGSTVTPDFKGGTLRVVDTGVVSSAFTVEASGGTIDAFGNAGTFSGTFEGAGGLTISDSIGGGKVVFTGTAAYSGNTTISQGATLQIGNGGTTGSITGNVADNGTLIFNRGDTITFANAISGDGSVVQAGNGTLILTGENTYTGGTTIAAGTLQIGDGNTSGSIDGDITNNGALIFNRSDATTYMGFISGTGSLTQAGAGVLTLTGENTYTGGTTIAAGTLQIGNGEAAGSITGDVTNNGALVFDRSDVATYAGTITGTGSLTQAGTGTLVLTGANTYTGGTTIATGTLQIGNGGTSGSVTGDITNNTALIFNRSDAVTYAGVISGTGSLTQAGPGTLVLTGANTYTGGTTIATGTLQIGNGGTSGSITGDITNNTTLIFNRSDAVTYAGVISGTGSMIQAGSGALILTGTNTYSGGTSIADGTTLQLGNGGQSGSIVGNVINNGALIYNRSNVAAFDGVISSSGSLHIVRGGLALTGNNTYSGGTTVDSGAVLQVGAGGSTGSFTGNVVNNGTVVFARDNSLSYGGAISGTGNVNVSSGTVILTGSSTYTGGTSIASGSTLQLGDGGTTGSITGNVVNHGILAFNRSDTVVFTGNVTGDGTLVQSGTGKVIVTTNYTGKTMVNSGTLQIGNGATSGTVTGNIVNNATVVYGQAATTTYSGVISGSGGVAVAGGGIVILNGANTYTGPTTVTAGSLVIGDVSHPGSGVAGTVTVSGAAMIGGYGVIGGSLVANGGIVSPGNSIGTLTVAGNYAPNSAATLKIEVSPAANDKLVVGGKAQLGGTLALSLQPGTYSTSLKSILTAGSVSGTFSTVTYSGGDAGMAYGVVYGAQEVDLAMTPKSSGQIYGDIVTQTLDTAEELNDATIGRLNITTAAGWSAWSKALSGASHTQGDAGLADFNSQLWGVISGADYQFSQGSKVSGVFSYTRNQIGVHGEGDKASVEGYFFALAGHVPVDAFAFDVTGFVQHNIVDTRRNEGGVGNASGSTSNLVGGGSVQASYSIDDLKPFMRLTVARIGTDSFKEAGALGFAVGSQALTSVRGSLGLEASHLFVTENGTRLLPHFMIGMEDEFGDTGRDTAITFASTDFTAPAPSPERYSALLGAGLTATLQDKLELSLETRGRISANQYGGILSVGAKYKF
jgi:autotransporter-associated beta strand repeat